MSVTSLLYSDVAGSSGPPTLDPPLIFRAHGLKNNCKFVYTLHLEKELIVSSSHSVVSYSRPTMTLVPSLFNSMLVVSSVLTHAQALYTYIEPNPATAAIVNRPQEVYAGQGTKVGLHTPTI